MAVEGLGLRIEGGGFRTQGGKWLEPKEGWVTVRKFEIIRIKGVCFQSWGEGYGYSLMLVVEAGPACADTAATTFMRLKKLRTSSYH